MRKTLGAVAAALAMCGSVPLAPAAQAAGTPTVTAAAPTGHDAALPPSADHRAAKTYRYRVAIPQARTEGTLRRVGNHIEAKGVLIDYSCRNGASYATITQQVVGAPRPSIRACGTTKPYQVRLRPDRPVSIQVCTVRPGNCAKKTIRVR